MAKKLGIKNVSITFLPFVPAHKEYFKSGKKYLGKMKDGEWYIFHYVTFEEDEYLRTEEDEYLQTEKTYFKLDDLKYWAQLPKLEEQGE